MAPLIIVDSHLQVDRVSAGVVEDIEGATLIAANADAAYACQLMKLRYSRIEDFAPTESYRREYADAVGEFLDWQVWLDEWARHRIPAFGRTEFKPAECASFPLQRIHGEIWSTSRSLATCYDAIAPTTIALWRPTIEAIQSTLEPRGTPLVCLAAELAHQRGIVIRDLAVDTVDATYDFPARRRPSTKRLLERVYDGKLREVGAALRSGSPRDALRAVWPIRFGGQRVMVCGYGYDAQRLVMELRRSNVDVRQFSSKMHDPLANATDVRAIREAVVDLFREPRLFQPAERCEVGRSELWTKPLRHWWLDLVPKMWFGYLTAEHQFKRNRFDAMVLGDVGNGMFGSSAAQAARACGVETFLYQHGGSADLDSPSLMPWIRGVDELLLYGDGTAADLRETIPSSVGRTASLRVVGSATLDELQARGCSRKQTRLRRMLQRSDSRPLVLYVPTHFGPYFRANGQLAGHPVVPYFELLQRVLRLWKVAKGSRLVFKDFIVPNDTRTVPAFIRNELPDAVITLEPMRDLMWAVDAIIVDHVITAAAEVLLTNKPCVFFMPSATSQAIRARRLLERTATVSSTPTGFVDDVRQLITECNFKPARFRDRSFLKAYGTHLDDGQSTRRAAAAVLRAEPVVRK